MGGGSVKRGGGRKPIISSRSGEAEAPPLCFAPSGGGEGGGGKEARSRSRSRRPPKGGRLQSPLKPKGGSPPKGEGGGEGRKRKGEGAQSGGGEGEAIFFQEKMASLNHSPCKKFTDKAQ